MVWTMGNLKSVEDVNRRKESLREILKAMNITSEPTDLSYNSSNNSKFKSNLQKINNELKEVQPFVIQYDNVKLEEGTKYETLNQWKTKQICFTKKTVLVEDKVEILEFNFKNQCERENSSFSTGDALSMVERTEEKYFISVQVKNHIYLIIRKD